MPESAKIIRLFRDAAFDPETVTKLCLAYEIVTNSLKDRGRRPKIVSEVIAERIVALAETGERDPEILAHGVLTQLGLEHR